MIKDENKQKLSKWFRPIFHDEWEISKSNKYVSFVFHFDFYSYKFTTANLEYDGFCSLIVKTQRTSYNFVMDKTMNDFLILMHVLNYLENGKSSWTYYNNIKKYLSLYVQIAMNDEFNRRVVWNRN